MPGRGQGVIACRCWRWSFDRQPTKRRGLVFNVMTSRPKSLSDSFRITQDKNVNAVPRSLGAGAPPSAPAAGEVYLGAGGGREWIVCRVFCRVIWQESPFNARAVSSKGAQGIAQFMPRTADWRGLSNPFDVIAALKASASYLRDLRDRFGNLGLAAACHGEYGTGGVNLALGACSTPRACSFPSRMVGRKTAFACRRGERC